MSSKLPELENLKYHFELYSSHWQEWSAYGHNGLEQSDIYVINRLRRLNFDIPLDQTFYFRQSILENITQKLELNYSEFQQWAIIKFQFCLISLAISENEAINSLKRIFSAKNQRSDLLRFFNSPIRNLSLEFKIEEALLNFGFVSITKMFEEYSDHDFKEQFVFEKILNFQILIRSSKYKLLCNTLNTI